MCVAVFSVVFSVMLSHFRDFDAVARLVLLDFLRACFLLSCFLAVRRRVWGVWRSPYGRPLLR